MGETLLLSKRARRSSATDFPRIHLTGLTSTESDRSREVPDNGHFARIIRVSAVLAVILVYCFVLWMGLTEESRRALTLDKSSATDNDFVIVNVSVTSIDTTQRLLHGRIRLIPMGRFAIDKTTPATNLTLLINSISGKQADGLSQRRANLSNRVQLVFSLEIKADIPSIIFRRISNW